MVFLIITLVVSPYQAINFQFSHNNYYFIYNYANQHFEYISPSMYEILGYASFPDNWTIENFMELFPPEDYEKFVQKELTSLSFAQKHLIKMEVHMCRKTRR